MGKALSSPFFLKQSLILFSLFKEEKTNFVFDTGRIVYQGFSLNDACIRHQFSQLYLNVQNKSSEKQELLTGG